MKKTTDFSQGRRGAVLSTRGKTRITLYLDDAVIQRFKTLSEQTGKGYQTLINETLTKSAERDADAPVTAKVLRKILREELQTAE